MEEIILSTIGKDIALNIKRLRVEKGLTQTGLSKASGISKIQIQRIEQCRGGTTVKSLEKIARVFNEHPEVLVRIQQSP